MTSEIRPGEICPICGRVPELAGAASLKQLGEQLRKSRAAILAGTDESIRTVAITVFVQSDAPCVEIARAMREILADAGVTGYQLGVAPVEGKS